MKAPYADAAVERKPLAMFTQEGYTRDAVKWADKAGVALYCLWGEDYQIRAAPPSSMPTGQRERAKGPTESDADVV